jgi:hypothetical protein
MDFVLEAGETMMKTLEVCGCRYIVILLHRCVTNTLTRTVAAVGEADGMFDTQQEAVELQFYKVAGACAVPVLEQCFGNGESYRLSTCNHMSTRCCRRCCCCRHQGAYSCICLVKGVGLVAFRDPHGIRPLTIGRRQGLDGKVRLVAVLQQIQAAAVVLYWFNGVVTYLMTCGFLLRI